MRIASACETETSAQTEGIAAIGSARSATLHFILIHRDDSHRFRPLDADAISVDGLSRQT